MISFLRGYLTSKKPTEITIDVNGVGYSVLIPLSTYENLDDPESKVEILTYLHLREGVMQLYGFLTEKERDLFQNLISISGIGPKMALSILSGTSVDEFRNLIVGENIHALNSLPGIGTKTAQRLIVELKDKFISREEVDITSISTYIPGYRLHEEALLALISLGYSRKASRRALQKAINVLGDEKTVEELIKYALREM